MKTRNVFALALLSCLLLFTQAALAENKTIPSSDRIAVPLFSNASGYGQQELQNGVTDMLISQLAKRGTLSVVERTRLEEAFSEAKLASSGALDPEMAVKLGGLLGARYLVLGTITKAGIEEKGTNFIITSKTWKADVMLTARVVDASTGLAIGSVEGSGDASRNITALSDGKTAIGGGTVSVDTAGLIKEAALKAVEKIASEIVLVFPVEGYVLKVDGPKIIIDLGCSKVTQGMCFSVSRQGQELIHPVTGASLGKEIIKVGKLRVTDTSAQYSYAEMIEGKDFLPGDNIRLEHPSTASKDGR